MVCGAGQVDGAALRIHDQQAAGEEFAAAGFHFLEADAVFVGAELHVVEDAHRRHDEAHLLRQLAAQRLDLVGDALALDVVDQRQQPVAQFDAQQVERQRGGDRFFARLGGDRGLGFFGDDCGGGVVLLLVGEPGGAADQGGQGHEHHGRHARQDGDDGHDGGHHAERLRIEGELADQRLVGGAFDAGLGHHQAGGGGDDQRRHLADQTVADGQQGEGVGGVGEAHAVLRDADDDAADDVDGDDQKAGDGVAAHEFGGAVHGAEEVGFRFQGLAPFARGGFVDQAGGEIGIDRHLLAGHGVQAEARGDFGDAARTLGDDDEVHDHQDREHDQADHEIALHDQLAEGLDHIAGAGGAVIAVAQDQPRRGEVERQPHHRGDQQDGREGREFQRLLDEHAGHQDQDRDRQRERQADVQQPWRQRHDQHDQDRHDAERQRQIAALEKIRQRRGVKAKPGARGGCGGNVCHGDPDSKPDEIKVRRQPAIRASPGGGTVKPA